MGTKTVAQSPHARGRIAHPSSQRVRPQVPLCAASGPAIEIEKNLVAAIKPATRFHTHEQLAARFETTKLGNDAHPYTCVFGVKLHLIVKLHVIAFPTVCRAFTPCG